MTMEKCSAPALTFRDRLDHQTRRLLPIGLLIAVGSLLALSVVVGKLGIEAGAPPLAFLCVSLIVSGSLLYGICMVRGDAVAIQGRVLEYGTIAGLTFLLPNIIGFMAVRSVGAGFLSFTFMFPLLITYCLALSIGMERFVVRRALAVTLGLVGGILLALSKANLGDAPMIWILLTMSAPLIIALGNIYRTLRWPEGVAPLFLASLILLFAGVMLVPITVIIEGRFDIPNLMQSSIVPYLALQILVYSMLYMLYFVLQKVAGPVYLSQIGSVTAVVGGLIATLLLGETMPPNLALAALFVAGGIMLFQWNSAHKRA